MRAMNRPSKKRKSLKRHPQLYRESSSHGDGPAPDSNASSHEPATIVHPVGRKHPTSPLSNYRDTHQLVGGSTSSTTSWASYSSIPVSLLPDPSQQVKKKRQRAEATADLLPDPMLSKKIKASSRDSIQKVADIQSANLTSRPAGLVNDISEDNKIAWAIAKYGCTNVINLCFALNTLPPSLTCHQRKTILNNVVQLGDDSDDDVANLTHFLEHQCSTLLQALNSMPLNPHVLAPPVKSCYGCGSGLVSYHSCNVKVYTVNGIFHAHKYTLRCKECCILYNYGQHHTW